MPLLKVCGVADEKNALEISTYCDYIGIIVDPVLRSPRLVDREKAERIVELCGNNKVVAVVASRLGVDVARSIGVRIVQVHCHSEDIVKYALELGLKVAPVLVAENSYVSPERVETFVSNIAQYSNCVEYVLIDASKSLRPLERGLKLSLDTYRIFIETCRKHNLKPAVAGGISPDNVDLVLRLGPYLVDVSSSIEIKPGVKDLNLVISLARKVKGTHT